MRSRGATIYLISGLFSGVLIVASLMVYILYNPGNSSSDKKIKTKNVMVNEEALSDSADTIRQNFTDIQEQKDTVYIFIQKEPLIVFSEIQTAPVDTQRTLAKAETDEKNIEQEEDIVDSDMMEAFEEAFNKVVEQEKESEKTRIDDNTASIEPSVDEGIMSEGMILDETQTRMGESFFIYFYNHWQAPQDASNFVITITEKIMPSRGSSLSIRINEELVFQTRLQPRYDYIEQLGQQAVAICHQRLNHTNTNSEYFQVY